YNQPFEDDFLVSMKTLTYSTHEGPKKWENVSTKCLKKWRKEMLQRNRGSQRDAEESRDVDVVSVRRKFEGIDLQNVGTEKFGECTKVRVDVIVQDDARRIPKWILVAPPGLWQSLHLASPVQELISNRATVCRNKMLSNECSSSRSLQLKYSGVPSSSHKITIPRHKPSPELKKTCSILTEYQSADEECSWSNITIADLYPAMVETLGRLMVKEYQRRELKCMFGHLRSKRWHYGRPKFNMTVYKIGKFRHYKPKKALVSICSSGVADKQNPTLGNESGEVCCGSCLINKSSSLVPYTDTSEIIVDCSDSSLEHKLVSGKGKQVSKQTVFPNDATRMGERFLVEGELQTTASLKNLECTGSEKLACQSSEYRRRISVASSESTALHLGKNKPQKTGFSSGDTSELCSSAYSSCGSSNTHQLSTSSSFARTSNSSPMKPEKIIPARQISSQPRHSLSSLFVEWNPSEVPQKYKDDFDKLYHELCCKEIQKPLTWTEPSPNSKNLEEKGRLVNCNLNDSVRSSAQIDRDFDRLYEKLCSEAAPKLPSFQRKCEGTQMSETVNALVNSPVQMPFTFPRVKRLESFPSDHLCSPVKRLKHTPESYFSSAKCQQISHHCFEDHSCQCQDSGFHAASGECLGIPGTSLQGMEVTYMLLENQYGRAQANQTCRPEASACGQNQPDSSMDGW
ncbi:PREDICTED: uncharacterized protein LOC103804004, partial [Acanthisitta chloris]|uniref:uncharacterized protein LOC103804004 n=1 Tax=Acanthisitta chloris TaxID=57068 RepID=UPI0004F0EBDC